MIKPLGNRVLVKPYENSELSKGGVYTGQATTTFVAGKDKAVQQTVGKVMAVGYGEYLENGRRIPPEAEIGAWVCFSDTCGQPVKDGEEDLLMITENDIAGFIPEPTTVELVYRD